jgi:hypothetical protein
MPELKERLLTAFPDSRLTPLTRKKVKELSAEHPDLPTDYIRFLADIGYGRIGEMRISVYSGPSTANDIYDEKTARKLSDVLLIGDNFGGYCIGYKKNKDVWVFGGVDESGKFRPIKGVDSFTGFLEYWLFK